MSTELSLLLGAAATLGFVHTVLGPDHYVPFIAMARARQWSSRRTMWITFLCGVAHVLGSALIGAAGLLFGIKVLKLEIFESARGNIAGWLLLGFGLAYMIWGIRRAARQSAPALTKFEEQAKDGNIIPWILFTIFIFGPCEPLIPVLMYPAATANVPILLAVIATFGLFTVGTMMTLVYVAQRGLAALPVRATVRYSHALAGFMIAACGAGIQFLGL